MLAALWFCPQGSKKAISKEIASFFNYYLLISPQVTS